MQGREDLTLDQAIRRASAAGVLVRREVVSVFLEVLLLAVDSALVPDPSRVVLGEDGSLSFTQPPVSVSVDPAVPVHAACLLATSLFRSADLEPPLSLQGPLETAAERFPTLRHLRDAFELELLMSGTPPPTDVERRMAIAALMAKARKLRGTSASPPYGRRAPAREVPQTEPPRISPHAAITTPAFRLRIPAWIHLPASIRPPAWMRRPLPRWAPIAGAAIAGALLSMLLQRGSTKPPPPPVAAAAPVIVGPPENHGPPPPADARVAVRERSTTPPSPADARVAVRERSTTPPSPPVRERGSAAQTNSPPDASPRPVRPLRRRVAAATEASASARARLQQGDESLRQGRFFEALVAFREALESDPSFAAAARRLGDAYREHHDTALAIAAYERYLEMEPSAADAEEVRSALEELRDPPSAVE